MKRFTIHFRHRQTVGKVLEDVFEETLARSKADAVRQRIINREIRVPGLKPGMYGHAVAIAEMAQAGRERSNNADLRQDGDNRQFRQPITQSTSAPRRRTRKELND